MTIWMRHTRELAARRAVMFSDMCAFVAMLAMCVWYVSLGSSVTPNICWGGGGVHG